MNIKWIGKYTGDNLPTADISGISQELHELPEVTNKSALLLIPIILILQAIVVFKNVFLTGVVLSRRFLLVGLVCGFLMAPLHELLHAVCFPRGSKVYMFYTAYGLGTTCLSPVQKRRFLLVNVFPSVILGVLPLIVFLFIPKEFTVLNSILYGISFVNIGASYADYMNVIHLLKVPQDATIQISGESIYWYKT